MALASLTRARYRKERPTTELVCELGFRPLAQPLVAVLLPLRVHPVAVVLANFAAGIAGAVLLAEGRLWQAALLVQLKTLLDNADGQLARASGKVSALGRYLDTESDFLVNAALLAAIAVHGGGAAGWVLCGVALLLLTFVLSADFNLERLWRREHGEAVGPAGARERGLTRVLACLYDRTLGVQDRFVERFAEARIASIAGPAADARAAAAVRRAYHDRATLVVLVNFGLSTQLAVLGACLVAGVPWLWPLLVVGCFAATLLVLARREVLGVRALRASLAAAGARAAA